MLPALLTLGFFSLRQLENFVQTTEPVDLSTKSPETTTTEDGRLNYVFIVLYTFVWCSGENQLLWNEHTQFENLILEGLKSTSTSQAR